MTNLREKTHGFSSNTQLNQQPLYTSINSQILRTFEQSLGSRSMWGTALVALNYFSNHAKALIVGAVSLALRFMIEIIPAESKCLYLIILFMLCFLALKC